jgi:integrase
MEVPKGETRSIEPRQKDEIDGFLDQKQLIAGKPLSQETLSSNFRILFDLAHAIKPKLLSEISKKELERYLLQKMKTDAVTTNTTRKSIIKCFYVTIGQEEKVSWIKARMPFPKIDKDKLPTTEELQKMLLALKNNKRDFALVSLMLESGCRPGEVRKLNINSLEDMGDHLMLIVKEGKTKGREGPVGSHRKRSSPSRLAEYPSKT